MDLLRTLPLTASHRYSRRNKLEQDLDEELRAHIGLATEENLKLGMSSRKARTVALRTFGGLTQAKEQYRAQRGFPFFEGLAQDIRFALRQLRKSWAFTATAAITLALAIGGNTVIFSIVNGVLLDPLPFPEPDQLVTLHESKPNFDRGSISYPNFLDWQKNNRVFSAMAVARRYAFSFTGRGDAEQVNAEFIAGDFFRILGVQPILGRTFTAEEEQPGAGPVALIGEGLWRRKLDSAPGILGSSITLDGRAYTVVGVIPAGFHLRMPAFQEQDIYAPIRQWDNDALMHRGAGLGIHGIARLKPGVSLEQARAGMDSVTRQLAAFYPDADHGIGASIIPLKEMMVGGNSANPASGACSGRIRAADCMRQRRQPAARPLRAAQRVALRGSAGGEPRKNRPPVAHREPSAGYRRGRYRAASGSLGYACRHRLPACGAAAF